MKRGGWTDMKSRRWFIAGFVLLTAGLIVHFIGGRPCDLPWLLLTIVAATVMVAGYYRHPPARD